MYRAPLLKKIFEIISVIVDEKDPPKLSEISKRAGVNKSTTFGILNALQREGYIQKDPKTKSYSISKGLLTFAKRIIRKCDLSEISRPFLESLSRSFDETVFLGIREGEFVRIVEVCEATKELKITSPVGTRLPFNAGATGKVVFSLMREDEVRNFIRNKGLKRYTDKTICDENEFLEEIRKVRERSYATDFEEYMKGVWAVASPVILDAELLAIVWIVGFTSLLKQEEFPSIIEGLKNTCHLISLSYSAWK